MSNHWLKYRGTRFPIRRGETTVGRSAYCTIVLSNHLASRQHCTLRATPNGLVIEDLGSTNGTMVNDERISGIRALSLGDVIRIGTDVLEVVEGEARARSACRNTTRDASPDDSARYSLEDSATGIHGFTLELVEALAASAAQTRDPKALAQPVQRALEAIVQRLTTEPLGRVQVARLHALIEKVAAWHADGELDVWRTEMLEAIRERDPP